MNKGELFFLLSVFGIFLLIFFSNFSFEKVSGRVEKIYYKNGAISIFLEGGDEIILFTEKILNLKEGEEIIVFGKVFERNKILAYKIILK